MSERKTGLLLFDACMDALHLGRRTNRRWLVIACNLRSQIFPYRQRHGPDKKLRFLLVHEITLWNDTSSPL